RCGSHVRRARDPGRAACLRCALRTWAARRRKARPAAAVAVQSPCAPRRPRGFRQNNTPGPRRVPRRVRLVVCARGRVPSRAMTRPDYIVSDVHLGAVPPETERRFVAFLEHVGGEAAQLLIAGDLFDFWFEYGTVIPGKHFRVLGAIAALVDGGIPVTFAGGNHDAWGGRFLREEVGVAFHNGPFRMTLGGRPALIAHGDGLGRGDLKYRILKAVLRSRVTVAGFRAIHPEIGLRIARAVST